ncbi:acyl carrier protein [Opitutaceae bacterium TAV3]|nr:acyl carrier protein [Opitutaceae bacterium TAV3]
MSELDTNPPPANNSASAGDDDAKIRADLRRCSPATIEAALAWRNTADASHLPAIVIGIVQRFSDPDLRPKLDAPDADNLRLIDDLGIDSLTMMEIVMLVEEVTRMSISNEELRYLRSIGDIKTFIDCKARGIPPPPPPPCDTSTQTNSGH